MTDQKPDAASNGETISRYFAAMRRGAAGEGDLMSLFAEDATYVEPFSGNSEPAVGHEQIRDRLRAGWDNPLPDLELDVLTMEIVASHAKSSWECRSSAFPQPVRGSDSYTFNSVGAIQRLEVRLDGD